MEPLGDWMELRAVLEGNLEDERATVECQVPANEPLPPALGAGR
jgi:hypothetical protein